MLGTRGLPKSDMRHTVPFLKALILYVGEKDVSVKTEQETHGVPLPTLPFLPEFTHDTGLHGALNAELDFLSFLFLETLAIPFSHRTFFFFFFLSAHCVLGLGILLVVLLVFFHWIHRDPVK